MMNHLEGNPDEAIDRLLIGLRDVEPPLGMGQRILEAAEVRTVEHPGWMSAVLMGARPWAVAFAGVVVLSLVTSLAVHRKDHGRIELIGVKPRISPTVVVPVAQIEKSHTGNQPRREKVSLSRPSEAKLEPLSAEGELALSETNAPSRPAPPLPLTHQEQLLADAVDQVGPEKLSSLRPELRAREMELSKTEVHDFFEPPPAKDNE